MKLSIVVPAFNAEASVGRTLASIFNGFDVNSGWELEVIVVDDGSAQPKALEQAVAPFPVKNILHHECNQGMCAARNTGFAATTGDIATLLDADDEFIADWWMAFLAIIGEWPVEAQVCLTPCLNDAGERTCSNPHYKGWETAEDHVRETYGGEYNPLFRGDYIRQQAYTDIGTRKSCGVLTYLRMVREHPFWITDQVMRLYHDPSTQSVTYGWTRPDKARETRLCFEAVLRDHGDFIRGVSQTAYDRMVYKTFIYGMLANQGRQLFSFIRHLSFRSLKEGVATAILLMAGPWVASRILVLSKKGRLFKRYG